MEKITINTIPDSEQRYNTVGDYYYDNNGDRIINISDHNNWKFEFLIALHELVEISLCKDRGITDEQIDNYDFAHENLCKQGLATGEPGDNILAPYHKEHIFAAKIEKMMADELGVNWGEYLKKSDLLNKEFKNTIV